MSTLIELTEKRMSIEELIDTLANESGGEVTLEIEMLFDEQAQVELDTTGKLDGYAYRIRALDKEAEIWEEREKKMATKKKAALRGAESMLLRVEMLAKSRNLRKIEGDTFSFGYRTNGGSLPVVFDLPDNLDDLPEEFRKIETKTNNANIKAALKAGQELDFAKFGPRGEKFKLK